MGKHWRYACIIHKETFVLQTYCEWVRVWSLLSLTHEHMISPVYYIVLAGVAGTRGAQLMSTPIPLTPGPLVVVLKDSCPDRDEPTSKCGPAWPPSKATAVETIAASFVPPKTGSAVRLFNLAADVHA
eukprot:COSAG06_NODE_4584_length_4125_cov_103.384501_9_plen_128_part_00